MTRIPNCQGIVLLLFPILSCAHVKYEAHYVRYEDTAINNKDKPVSDMGGRYIIAY